MANASVDSRLPYFRGKGQVEEILQDMGIPFAIVRPTLVFGEDDLLLNNIAWALRRFPVFPVFGSGEYRVQPIYAEVLTALAVAAGCLNKNYVAADAGSETFSLRNHFDCWPRWYTFPPPLTHDFSPRHNRTVSTTFTNQFCFGCTPRGLASVLSATTRREWWPLSS